MAQAPSLETLIFNDYVKRGMNPNEALANAREAAAAYRTSSGLSDEEILGSLREQREAADFKSLANQILAKSTVLSETPRRASLQRLLGAGALTTSLNPETRQIGEAALKTRMPDPAVRAAMEKSVNDQNQAQRTALYDERMRRGAVPLSENLSPEAIAHAESVRRPYDVSPMVAEQDRKNAALTAARNASAREALAVPEGGEMPAGGQSYRYDMPTTSRPFQPVAEQARDLLRARLAVPVAGSIPAPEGTDVSEFSALDYVGDPWAGARGEGTPLDPNKSRASQLEEPPKELVGSTAGGALVKGAMPSPGGVAPSSANVSGSLPLMARAGADDNIMGFRGGAYTPGASPDRTMRLNMPGLFPAQAPAAGATATPVARREVTQPSRAAEAPREETASLLSRIFGRGPEYQSTGDRVVKEGGQGVNFGSGESAADFFRADRALRAQRPEMFERQAEARGGAPKAAAGNGGKDAALHKALEIIHHLLTRGR